MIRRYKNSTLESWYCKPNFLQATIEDLKIRAGKGKTIITMIGNEIDLPKEGKKLYIIAIERRLKEYHVILNVVFA